MAQWLSELKCLQSKREVPSSNPPGVKIYFDAKPISNFKNLLDQENMTNTMENMMENTMTNRKLSNVNKLYSHCIIGETVVSPRYRYNINIGIILISV